MKISGRGRDEYGLPSCPDKESKRIRDKAISKLNKAIRKQNKNIEQANELRFYKNNGSATKRQLQKLEYLESKGY